MITKNAFCGQANNILSWLYCQQKSLLNTSENAREHLAFSFFPGSPGLPLLARWNVLGQVFIYLSYYCCDRSMSSYDNKHESSSLPNSIAPPNISAIYLFLINCYWEKINFSSSLIVIGFFFKFHSNYQNKGRFSALQYKYIGCIGIRLLEHLQQFPCEYLLIR